MSTAPVIPPFNGDDYVHKRDHPRLSAQHIRIRNLMSDGIARTLAEIANAVDAPESSVSAQLRHLRKPRFGGHTIERKYLGNGLYAYRLVLNQEQAALS